MTYIKVRWHHSDADEPVILFSELDQHRWEVRKIEIYADGSCGYATAEEQVGGTWLGLVPVPSLAEIAAEAQFEPLETSKEEFERVWETRDQRTRAT